MTYPITVFAKITNNALAAGMGRGGGEGGGDKLNWDKQELPGTSLIHCFPNFHNKVRVVV